MGEYTPYLRFSILVYLNVLIDVNKGPNIRFISYLGVISNVGEMLFPDVLAKFNILPNVLDYI